MKSESHTLMMELKDGSVFLLGGVSLLVVFYISYPIGSMYGILTYVT